MSRPIRILLLTILLAIGISACGKSDEKSPAGAVSQGNIAPAMSSASPALVAGAEAMVVIGDLQKTIDGMGRVAAQIQPQINADGIRAILGGQLGDPLLEAIPPGAGAVVAAMPGRATIGFLEVDPTRAEDYASAFRTRGQQARYTGGLLVVADTAAQAARGENMVDQVRSQILDRHDAASIHVVSSPAQFLASHPMLAAMFTMLNKRAQNAVRNAGGSVDDVQRRQRAVGLQFAVFQSLLTQVEVLELAAAAPPEGVRLDVRLRARPGTSLARFLSLERKPAGDVARTLPGTGSLRLARTRSSGAWRDLVLNEARAVLGKMPVSEAERAAGLQAVERTLQDGGEFLAIDLLPGQSKGISGAGLYGIESSQKGLEDLRAGVDEIALRLIPRMRSALGAEGRIELVQNAKTHNGIAIHEVKAALDFAKLTPETASALSEMAGNLNMRFALTDKAALWSVGEQEIEPVIDAWRAGRFKGAETMEAQKHFGSGATTYVDADLAALADVAAQLLTLQAQPGTTIPMVLRQTGQSATMLSTILAGARPATGALFVEDGAMRLSLLAPNSLLAKTIQAFMLIRMRRPVPEPPREN